MMSFFDDFLLLSSIIFIAIGIVILITEAIKIIKLYKENKNQEKFKGKIQDINIFPISYDREDDKDEHD